MNNTITTKPWTAIILLNEEYFVATEEQEKLIRRKDKDPRVPNLLPISYMVSRKTDFTRSPPQPLPGIKPWEQYYTRDVVTLNYEFDVDNPEHTNFNLQDQAKRDYSRGLQAVFIEYFEIELQIFEHKTSYRIGFKLRQIPKKSETLKMVQAQIRKYESDYRLYSRQSKQSKKLYKRIYSQPSCLEICGIKSVDPSGIFKPKTTTDKYLSGDTEESQTFMQTLGFLTGWVIEPAYKRYDSTVKGFVLDGLVREL